VSFVFAGECALRHDTERVCGADFNDALRRLLAEDDILRLNPPHGRGELVCEQLNEQRVRKLLLDLGTHDEVMEGAIGGKEGGLRLDGAQWVSLLQNRRRVSWV
jgi:hypothetical protein